MTIHFALPTLGCAKEKDVDDLIGGQTLSVIKCWWTTSNLLGVDVTDMHDALLHTNVNRLPCFTSQASLDTLECFVGQEILDDFVQRIFDHLWTIGFIQMVQCVSHVSSDHC